MLPTHIIPIAPMKVAQPAQTGDCNVARSNKEISVRGMCTETAAFCTATDIRGAPVTYIL
jgi:hypothetical protein